MSSAKILAYTKFLFHDSKFSEIFNPVEKKLENKSETKKKDDEAKLEIEQGNNKKKSEESKSSKEKRDFQQRSVSKLVPKKTEKKKTTKSIFHSRINNIKTQKPEIYIEKNPISTNKNSSLKLRQNSVSSSKSKQSSK